jgi:hypothetical protein
MYPREREKIETKITMDLPPFNAGATHFAEKSCGLAAVNVLLSEHFAPTCVQQDAPSITATAR